MAQQRLSKLQGWILRNCYHEQNGQVYRATRKEDILRFFKNTYFIGSHEFVINDNFKAFMSPAEYNRAHATISRSLKGLRDKGFVRLMGKKQIEEPDYGGAIELARKYKTKEELNDFLKSLDPGELMKMTDKFMAKGTKIDIAVEIKDNDKTNVRIIELTDLGVEKAKELLRLSS